jgi:hypothetical protein
MYGEKSRLAVVPKLELDQVLSLLGKKGLTDVIGIEQGRDQEIPLKLNQIPVNNPSSTDGADISPTNRYGGRFVGLVEESFLMFPGWF